VWLRYIPSNAILLIHIFKFAEYNTINSNTSPNAANRRDLGNINKNPKITSHNPLNNTQNIGNPIIFGTIGLNQFGSRK